MLALKQEKKSTTKVCKMSKWLGPDVSFMDRVNAAKIMHELRNSRGRKYVANMLGISPIYVTYAEKNYRRTEETFLTPRWVIKRILEWKLEQK